MRIQVRYESNRLDVFDTASFTKPEPFDGANMLTNFEVRVDELGNTGLWLVAHQFQLCVQFRGSGFPIAFFRKNKIPSSFVDMP